MPIAGDFTPFSAATPKTGALVEWNSGRAFGYLECEGKRVFLQCISGGTLSREVLSLVRTAAK
jgi:hypothetical protein